MSVRMDDHERAIYILLAYSLCWGIVWSMAVPVLGRPLGAGVTAFVYGIGLWFLPIDKGPRLTFPRWTGLAVLLGAVASVAVLAVERAFSLIF